MGSEMCIRDRDLNGIELDPNCTASDECGIIFSMEEPSRRNHNFWPEQANSWPEHQVIKSLSVLELFFHVY